MSAWIYNRIDGEEYVVRASTLAQAQVAAQRSEQERTGSIAAGNVAALSVRPLVHTREEMSMYRGSEGIR